MLCPCGAQFQMIIVNGDMMKCGGKCENMKLQMEEYLLKFDMLIIEMGSCDVVLRLEQLQTLGLELQWISRSYAWHSIMRVVNMPLKISSRKGSYDFFSQLNAIQVMDRSP